MNRHERLADIELSILENSDLCSEVIARHLDIDGQDHAWLVNALADLLLNPDSLDVMGALITALEKHIGPVITQEAADELERLEDPA